MQVKKNHNSIDAEKKINNVVKLIPNVTRTRLPVKHPHSFTYDEMELEVDLLTVNKFSWGDFGFENQWIGQPVFVEEHKQVLLTGLVDGFKSASPQQVIWFNTIGRGNQRTIGKVFIQANNLVWVFELIDGRKHTGKDKFWLDDHDWGIEKKYGINIDADKENGLFTVERNLLYKPDQVGSIVAGKVQTMGNTNQLKKIVRQAIKEERQAFINQEESIYKPVQDENKYKPVVKRPVVSSKAVKVAKSAKSGAVVGVVDSEPPAIVAKKEKRRHQKSVIVPAPPPPVVVEKQQAVANDKPTVSEREKQLEAKLITLKRWVNSGLIGKEEYQAQKQQILTEFEGF